MSHNSHVEDVRSAIKRAQAYEPSYGQDMSVADLDLVAQAAGHYADLLVILTELFGGDAERNQAELEVEIGRELQAYIEKVATRGGPHNLQELGRAALAPVLTRLQSAISA